MNTLTETEFTPQRILKLRGIWPNALELNEEDRVAFLGAHPDDIEMFMAYAALQAGRLNPGQTFAYVATDGEASIRGDEVFVRNHGRTKEALAGLGRVGISADRVRLAGFEDDTEGESIELVLDIADFYDYNGITVAVTPGREGVDSHPKHIGVHNAAIQAGGYLDLIWGSNKTGGGEAKICGMAHLSEKLGSLAMHRSQFPIESTNGLKPADINQRIKEGWVRSGIHLIPPEIYNLIDEHGYLPYLNAETYDLYHRSPDRNDLAKNGVNLVRI